MTTKPATPLPWAVFDSDGNLRARMESESEAHFYIKNRGHVNGGSYRNDDGDMTAEERDAAINALAGHNGFDAAAALRAYPRLVEALRSVERGLNWAEPHEVEKARDAALAEIRALLRELGEKV